MYKFEIVIIFHALFDFKMDTNIFRDLFSLIYWLKNVKTFQVRHLQNFDKKRNKFQKFNFYKHLSKPNAASFKNNYCNFYKVGFMTLSLLKQF